MLVYDICSNEVICKLDELLLAIVRRFDLNAECLAMHEALRRDIMGKRQSSVQVIEDKCRLKEIGYDILITATQTFPLVFLFDFLQQEYLYCYS